jgi:hypothetical protein
MSRLSYPRSIFPRAWFLKAREAVDECRLAGSVGADQTENFVPREPEIDVSDGQKAAKSDRLVIGEQMHLLQSDRAIAT